MGGFEIPLPVGAHSVRLVKDGIEYPIDIDTHGFTRVGEGGTSKILTLFGGTEFQEEYLDGEWEKHWSGMDANQVFTAIVNNTDAVLEMEGESDVAGTLQYGWIFGRKPIPLLDETEIAFALEVPTDDTGATANRDITLEFYLVQDKSPTTSPPSTWNLIKFNFFVDESGLRIYIIKEVNNVQTVLEYGHDYTMDGTASTGDLTACMWRVVFNGKPGTSGATMSVYLRQSDTLENAETSEENEVTGSPFDISDLYFNVGYPIINIGSQNTTYFDSGGQARIGFVRVSYPHFEIKYNTPDDNILLNTVSLWDGDPDAGGIQVFDEDHVFANDIYLQNGLFRIVFDEGSQDDINTYVYIGGAWERVFYTIEAYLDDTVDWLEFNYVKKIIYLSAEKVVLRVKLTEDAIDDDDFYALMNLTLEKGKTYVKVDNITIYPLQDARIRTVKATSSRFAYGGDETFLDGDLEGSAVNTTRTDNIIISFDDEGNPVLNTVATNRRHSERFYLTINASYPYSIPSEDLAEYVFFLGAAPFSDIANLFTEAEDTLYSGAAREFIDAEHDGFDSDSGDTYDDDGVTEAQPDSGESIKYEDDEGIFTAYNSGVGNYTCALSEETTIVKSGTSSLKITVTEPGPGNVDDIGAYIVVNPAEDWSGKKYAGFWFYGLASGETWRFHIRDTDTDYAYWAFTDNVAGWKWLCFDLSNPTADTGLDLTIVDRLYIFSTSCTGAGNLYVDLITFFDGVWTDDADGTATINDVSDPQVNNYAVKCYADNTDASVDFSVYPISPIVNLMKFDDLKFYAKGSTALDLSVRIVDGAGESIRKTQSITTSPVEYSLEIPHTAAEAVALGWTDSGAFDYEDFDYIYFRSNMTAGDYFLIDGLHFYIDETTDKGRGETLSGGEAVVLDAQWEYVAYQITAGTDLPAGMYLAVIRVKDTDQVASDVGFRVINETDSSYRNEMHGYEYLTVTAAFAYYLQCFFISESDEDDGDTIGIWVRKMTATENTIFVDDIILIPLSNGESLPQDVSHNAMRPIMKKRVVKGK